MAEITCAVKVNIDEITEIYKEEIEIDEETTIEEAIEWYVDRYFDRNNFVSYDNFIKGIKNIFSIKG